MADKGNCGITYKIQPLRTRCVLFTGRSTSSYAERKGAEPITGCLTVTAITDGDHIEPPASRTAIVFRSRRHWLVRHLSIVVRVVSSERAKKPYPVPGAMKTRQM